MAASLVAEEKRKPKETLLPVEGLVEWFQRKGAPAGSKSVLTSTSTDFWYYNCMDEMDSGWGCTYRYDSLACRTVEPE
jgi:hypothetical protein